MNVLCLINNTNNIYKLKIVVTIFIFYIKIIKKTKINNIRISIVYKFLKWKKLQELYALEINPAKI